MTATAITLDGVASTTITELIITRVTRQLVGTRRDTFVEVPGRPGAWAFHERPGDRTIVVEFDLQGASIAARRSAVRRLADWADTPFGAVHMIINDEPDRYYTAILADGGDVDEWLVSGTGELTFRVGPYAFNTTPATATFHGTGTFIVDGVTNAESVEVYPVLEITPTNGTIVTLDLAFGADSALSWGGLIADDDTLTVSSLSDTITTGVNGDVNLTGAFDPGLLSMGEVVGTFPILLPGANPFTFIWSGTATAVTFTFTWQRRYR